MASVDIQAILSKATSLTQDQIRSVLSNTSMVRPVTVAEALAVVGFRFLEGTLKGFGIHDRWGGNKSRVFDRIL